MGGFMLYENGVMVETLVIERLEELESEGRIYWPSISEKEIEDRSKGDAFSKAFAVLQTTWFVIQCVARGVYGLAITELEVATLAFAVLNGALYFLSWNKPLGVVCPVPVYLLSSTQEAGTQTTDSEDGESPFAFYCEKFQDMVLGSAFSHLVDMVLCTTAGPALSVLTFYAPSCGTQKITIANRSAYIGSIIGSTFGGIHCIAWSFQSFPSVEEQYHGYGIQFIKYFAWFPTA